MQEGQGRPPLIVRTIGRESRVASCVGLEHDEESRWKDPDQRMVRRRRTIHPSTIKTRKQDPVPRRKPPQRMGTETIPQRKNQQRSAEKILDGANLHNLRLQNRLHRTRIEDSTSGKRDVEDRLPPRIQPEPQETSRHLE